MKSSKKMFILVECILGCLLIGMIIFTVQKRQGQDLKRISVIIQNSDETQWSAFKYGLKMAAQDENVDVFIINPTQTRPKRIPYIDDYKKCSPPIYFQNVY